MKLPKIISGGQTGVDKIALQVALALGYKTGGTAAKGWWTEDGPDETLSTTYGLVQGGSYPTRTVRNILDSDGTVIFNPYNSPGTQFTINTCKKLTKPYKENPSPDEIMKFMQFKQIVNFAGPRRSKLTEDDVQNITTIITKGLLMFKEWPLQL